MTVVYDIEYGEYLGILRYRTYFRPAVTERDYMVVDIEITGAVVENKETGEVKMSFEKFKSYEALFELLKERDLALHVMKKAVEEARLLNEIDQSRVDYNLEYFAEFNDIYEYRGISTALENIQCYTKRIQKIIDLAEGEE